MMSETDAIARKNVAVLVAAQAIMGGQIPMIFTFGGLAGQSLASNACFATLPISMIVLGSMLTATPLSAFMQQYGRRAGFALGALGGAVGAAISAYGLLQANFALLCFGSLFTGMYMSAQGFFRFAAADRASDAFRPKAISYVMAGGLMSAVIGPQLGAATVDALVVPFLGVYLAIVALNLGGMGLFWFLDIPKPDKTAFAGMVSRSRWELMKTPRVATAVIVATVTYALMNLVMTSTPLAVVGCGFAKSDASQVVTAHVLAMYAPSFITGAVIARFGVERVMTLGLFILTAAAAVAVAGIDLMNFYAALILLGVGWNFGFIGATTMLTSAVAPSERGRMQGLNDLIVFGGVTFASLSSGGLMNCSGTSVQAGWQAVNIAMLPFLVLAGGVLIWLWLRDLPKPAP